MSVEASKAAMESWLKGYAKKAGTGGKCEVLLQGYPFTGFACFSGTLEPPPDWQNVFLDRDLYWDIRLFGDLGEVHLWRKNSSGKWGERFAPKQGECWRERQCVLWSKAEPDGAWTRLSETRGVDFHVPGTFSKGKEVALKTRVRVARDERNGLAGIVDMMIVGIAEAKKWQ